MQPRDDHQQRQELEEEASDCLVVLLGFGFLNSY